MKFYKLDVERAPFCSFGWWGQRKGSFKHIEQWWGNEKVKKKNDHEQTPGIWPNHQDTTPINDFTDQWSGASENTNALTK